MSEPSNFSLRLLIAIFLIGFIFVVNSTNMLFSQNSCKTVYTNDEDFDQGSLINLNHNSPNNNQLQINDQTAPPPFIWVACSDRGTVVRIDVNTGTIIGEYKTAPDGRGRNPSRTTVDLYGNVWVGNRDESSFYQNVQLGSVIKIGVTIGGTRCDATGNPDPNGEYLKPPFVYNTAIDKDGDGLIKTSKGLGDIRPWLNTGGVDDGGGVSTAEDEAILLYVRTPAQQIRHVSIDANNDVWVGGFPNYNPQVFNKIDGNTGLILLTYFVPGCGGYGGLIDGNGILWSASLFQSSLMRYDISSNLSQCIPSGTNCLTYGLAVDDNGFIWNSLWACGTINKISPAGTVIGTYNTGGNCGRGVAVTSDNNIWVANSCTNDVSRLDNNGNVLKVIPVGNMPTGVAVDANGKVWVTNYSSDDVMRIDPNGGGDGLGAVDLTVSLGQGAGPYNYSDMTGAVAVGVTSLQGTWNVVNNSGVQNTDWGKVSWTESLPAGTSIKVEVRASNTIAGLSSATFTQVTNNTSFCGTGITGQYLEIRATLSRQPFISATPILYDLTVEYCDNTPPEISCPDDIYQNVDPNSCDAVVTWDDPVVSDNCGNVTVTCNPSSGSTFPIGTTTVTCVATDEAGNTSQCTFDVNVIDNIPPTITVTLTPNVLWPPNHKLVDITASVNVDDNCGSSGLTFVLTSITSNEAENGLGDGDTPDDIQGESIGTADLQFKLRSERSGRGSGRIYTITYDVTDASGNTSSASATVTVPHNKPKEGDIEFNDNVYSNNIINIMPNPADESILINYKITEYGNYTLSIYNSLGSLIKTLFTADLEAGSFEIMWNTTDDNGYLVPNGIYYIRLKSDKINYTKSVTIFR